ncbi:MAG: TonB-dependent receptor [Gallionellaceae bacterium]|nr:TonB-dependent receptor [Gallionellaceae bacterium]
MHLKLYCLWLVGVAFLASTFAHADLTALPLEALLSSEVISASRFPQQAREAPSAVSIITAREIREHGWRSLAEALAGVRGVLVANDHAYSYLGPRGLLRPSDYNTHVLIMLDGVRLNDNVYTQGPLGAEFPLDMEGVERIEYVPGPGASIYGNNAFLGVVNVITRTAAAQPGGEAGAELGSAGWRRARVGMSDANGNRDWLLSLSHGRRDGSSPYSDGVVGNINRLDGEENTRLYARLGLGDLKISALLARRDKADPTAPYDTLIGDPRSRIRDQHGHLGLAWQTELTAGMTGDFLADYGDYRFRGDYPGDRTTLSSDLKRDNAVGRWLNLQARLTDRRLAGHKLVWGAEWQQDLERRQHGENISTASTYLDSNQSGHLAGLYLQDEWRLNDTWLLNLGTRYDHHSSFGGAFNPRLGLIQRVTPRTTLKYLAGTAYRAANAYELFYEDAGGSQKVNPSGLKPERIRTLEFVAEHETASNWLLTGTLFQYRIRDLITQISDPADGLLMFTNQDTLQSGGIALQAERRWANGEHLRLSVSRLRSRDGQGNRVSLSPDLLAKASANLPLGGWNLGLECHYVGPRRDSGGGEVAGYSVVHLNLIAPRLADHGELSLRIRNLFDRRYSDPAGDEHTQTAITQEGRVIEARLAWHF